MSDKFELVLFYTIVDDDVGAVQNKNGHILPTGQWYAPSAVINDALIMPEYARVCKSSGVC